MANENQNEVVRPSAEPDGEAMKRNHKQNESPDMMREYARQLNGETEDFNAGSGI